MAPFRIYRKIELGEFFLIGGDCSQGGADRNFASFLSKNKIDFPFEYAKRGVAADMTADIHPVLEWLCDTTGVKPVVAFERNNGGGSEMERLRVLNRHNKYILYQMKRVGTTEGPQETEILGYETNIATRPILLGEWKQAYDAQIPRIYDEEVAAEHQSFIINSRGKPEAAKKRHDDSVISHAVSWQLYQQCEPVLYNPAPYIPPKNDLSNKDWSFS